MTKNKKSLLSGLGFIVESFSLSFHSEPLKYGESILRDKQLLKNDWTNVGNSIRGGIDEIKNSTKCCKDF
ncbi:hypothetical protein NRK67_11995 [Fusobacteria bacterium ZRK30]|nr:hypothetical protein NRK67_11995 [Fusobacteria bacterium ZRK30]